MTLNKNDLWFRYNWKMTTQVFITSPVEDQSKSEEESIKEEEEIEEYDDPRSMGWVGGDGLP